MADPSYISGGVLEDGEAWVALATTTLGSDTASVTFTSANDGSSLDWCQFMDLTVIAYMATDRASTNDLMNCHLNGDTTNANYPYQYIWGDGGSGEIEGSQGGSSARGIDSRFCSAASSTNIFSAVVYNFLDMNSGKYKTTLVRTANNLDAALGSSISAITTSAWLSNAAITSIAFTPNTGSNIAAGSMFSLFGILPRMVS